MLSVVSELPDQLTDDHVTELPLPLIKACRNCHRPDKVDSRGYTFLRRLSVAELRYGIRGVVMMTKADDLKSPMSFLVSLAKRYAAGDDEFFTRPVLTTPPPTP